MTTDIFNDYNEDGYRLNMVGCRSHKTEDNGIRDNIRHKIKYGGWDVLTDWSDQKLVNAYDEFAMTDMFGNNDERFLEFCKDYE